MRLTQDHGWRLPETASAPERGITWTEYSIVSPSPDPTAAGMSESSGAGSPDCPDAATESILHNRILAALPKEDFSQLRSHLQQFRFKRDYIFYNIAARFEFVCFPLAGMIGLLAVMHDGRTVLLAATGREGFLGVPAILGEEHASLRAVALLEGTALTLERNQLSRILPTAPQLSAGLRRYCEAYLKQVVQIGACHALHNVSQRVAMWLLMVRDRSNSDSLPLTHETLGEMLGCRRSSISEALALLQRAGATRGARGSIRIVDRVRLAEQSCECYAYLR